MIAGIAQLVEHNLAKVGVAGSSPVSRFFLLRSGGETGRREGLKIPWDKIPCGFDPRPEHPLSLALRPDSSLSFIQKPFTAENLAMHVCMAPNAAA